MRKSQLLEELDNFYRETVTQIQSLEDFEGRGDLLNSLRKRFVEIKDTVSDFANNAEEYSCCY